MGGQGRASGGKEGEGKGRTHAAIIFAHIAQFVGWGGILVGYRVMCVLVEAKSDVAREGRKGSDRTNCSFLMCGH